MKKINEKYSPKELAESFVFRNQSTREQKEELSAELAEARKQVQSEMDEKDELYAQVLQLRFQIEDYLKASRFDTSLTFASFLRQYIKLGYKMNKEFAADINLDETELSAILNKHRSPSDKTIIRLELHSNNAIPAITWYKLLEKEKEHRIQSDQKIRENENRFVKKRLLFNR